MDLSNFYPSIYMKLGDGVTLTTQPALTTALSSWTDMFGCETTSEMKTTSGKSIQINTGGMVKLSEKMEGKIVLLEATQANYEYLRTTFHKKICSFIFNEIFTGGTGIAVQAKSVYAVVNKSMKSGDLLRIEITFNVEAKSTNFEVKELALT